MKVSLSVSVSITRFNNLPNVVSVVPGMSVTILRVIKYGQTLCFRWNHLCMWCIWSSSFCMCFFPYLNSKYVLYLIHYKQKNIKSSVFEIIKSTQVKKVNVEWRPNSACDGLVSYQCKCSLRYGSLGPGTSGSVMTWKKVMEMEQWDEWKDWRDTNGLVWWKKKVQEWRRISCRLHESEP